MFAAPNSRIPGTTFICRFFLLAAVVVGAECIAQATTTFTVTKTADTNDGFCDADCSLREAITAANNTPGKDTIAFSIGSGAQTIMPLSMLPFITESVVIDGTTQPGFAGMPLIEIDGTSAGTNVPGLILSGDSSTVRGLVINRFSSHHGIVVGGTGHHLIVGNFVGTDITGTIALGNFAGVVIGSGNNIVGGTTPADRNIVSGNVSNSGIAVAGPNAVGNLIQGNYVGTDVTGTINLGNSIGVRALQGSSNNTIGGSTPGAGNLISGNTTGVGIATVGNKVIGNYIGTKVDGVSALPNNSGVEISNNGHDNAIGGTGAGEGNVIAFNNATGVWISNGSKSNAILGNSIFSNKGMGIDLYPGGVTSNDQLDSDTGSQTANEDQNYPAITTITPNGNNTNINGTFNSLANTQFRLEFFSNPAADVTGFGEGKTFLGFLNVNTDGNGDASFNFSVPTASIVGPFITSTATDPLNNTSEFSQAIQIGDPGTLQFTSASYTVSENGGATTITVTRTGGTAGPVSVQYSTSGGTATAGLDYTVTSGVLSWLDGQSGNKAFTIPVIEDTLDESDEDVHLSLSNPTGGAAMGNVISSVVITDNDPSPTISINDVSQAEGNAGTSTFTFTATLSSASGQVVTADYATSDSTAQGGGDYQSISDLIVFEPGETSKPITVTVNGDTQSESNETFFVTLSIAGNATFAKAQGTGTILDDENMTSPTLQFSQASSSIQEDLGALIITVTRSGDTSAAASVDYTIVDGGATQKGDFEYAAGTLKFAAGETSKTFQILINEDMFLEGVESFTVALNNPAGATLGAQSTTTISISDDAPESPSNTIDDAQNFVHMQYHDFLNREPDPAGLAFWTNQITSCGADQGCIAAMRVNTSAAFFLSIEFQETGFLVERAYKAAYGNMPGTPVPLTLKEFVIDSRAISQGVIVNQAGWQQQLEANKKSFLTDFVKRARFNSAYPTFTTPSQFVDALFASAGVSPSPDKRQAAIDEFAGAATSADSDARGRVLRYVVEHPGFTQQEFSRAFVLMQYFGYLRRNPNDAPEPALNFDGYNFWLNKLNVFNGNFIDAEMVKAFITSFEYRQRFGP